MRISHFHVWDIKNKGDLGIVMAVQDLIKNIFPGSQIIDFNLESLKNGLTEQELETVNSCDIVIVGGGGIYYRWFLPFKIESIRKINKPIVMFGVGYINEIGAEPLSQEMIKSVIDLNTLTSLSSVRDINTLNFLKANGMNKNLHLIGDPAIFLEERKPLDFKIIKDKTNIGININYSGWLGFGLYEKEIIRAYNDTLKMFQNKYDADIYYFLHHPDERKVLEKISVKNIKIVDLDPKEQKYVYGQMDMIIGMMLHSVVMSFGAGTTFLNIGYDIRNAGFSEFIGCPELNISAEKLKDIPNFETLAENILKNKEMYEEKFKNRKVEIWHNHQNFLKKIKSMVKS